MKNKIIIALFAGFMLLALSACNNKPEIGEEFFNEVNSFDGMSLEIDQTTVSPLGATFVILNTTDREVLSGKPYQIALQVEKDGQWHQMVVKSKQGEAETAEAYTYPKNEPRIVEVEWAKDYGVLTPGRYRIIKGFFIADPNRATESFMLADEFEIT